MFVKGVVAAALVAASTFAAPVPVARPAPVAVAEPEPVASPSFNVNSFNNVFAGVNNAFINNGGIFDFGKFNQFDFINNGIFDWGIFNNAIGNKFNNFNFNQFFGAVDFNQLNVFNQGFGKNVFLANQFGTGLNQFIFDDSNFFFGNNVIIDRFGVNLAFDANVFAFQGGQFFQNNQLFNLDPRLFAVDKFGGVFFDRGFVNGINNNLAGIFGGINNNIAFTSAAFGRGGRRF